ncbi:hypothetical protein JTB14_026246 [Gonioctena quinquepunctata]|nr:hypothetical protein JTB14_026246 [Gonioctena quinquepunctata]
MCVTAILYAFEIAQNDQIIFKYGFCIESGGTEMEKIIMDDIKKIKYFCFVSLVVSLIGTSLMSPFNGDEDTFMFQYILMKKWFGEIGVIDFIISLIYCGINGHYIMSCVLITAHTVSHIRFQFLLLILYLENESEKFKDPKIVNDEERQRKIHEVLKNCMKQYLRIKK